MDLRLVKSKSNFDSLTKRHYTVGFWNIQHAKNDRLRFFEFLTPFT